MNPKKTKAGTYHVTAYVGKVNGKKLYKSFTAITKRECILKATEYINHHSKDANDPTVKIMVDNYIESKEPVLSPSTIREYIRIRDNDLVKLYDYRLSELDNIILQKFVSSMNLAPKTVANRYRFLMSAINMYSDRKFKVTLPQPQEPKRTVATEDDIARLLSAADDEMKKAILLGSCSLRRGEICALKYEDIKDDMLYVHADIVHDKDNAWIYKDHAKTPESTRMVKVSSEIIKALGHGSGYVVKVANPNALTQSFSHLRDRLGIDVSLHSLRRFYASICHALGIPDKYIMAQGGWRSPAVMRNSYQQTLDKETQKFNAIFEEHFDKTIKRQ